MNNDQQSLAIGEFFLNPRVGKSTHIIQHRNGRFDSKSEDICVRRVYRDGNVAGGEFFDHRFKARDLIFARDVYRIGIARGRSKLEDVRAPFDQLSRMLESGVQCKISPSVRERILSDVDDADDSGSLFHSRFLARSKGRRRLM